MAKSTVKVVLRDDVENLGRSGELVTVKPGYARNYLLPRGLAAVATHGNVAQIEHEKRSAIKRGAKLRASAEDVAKRLEVVTLTIKAQAGENGKLFGSIGSKDVAAALEKAGHGIDKRKIMLTEPLKEVGSHEVSIKLGYEVNATIKVEIKAAE